MGSPRWNGNKPGFIRSSSSSSSAQPAFEKTQRKTKALLVTSINSFSVHLITECQTPKEIWNKLKESFERNTVTNKLFLKQKFFSLKMKDQDSLDEHLRRMKEIADQLAAIKAPIPEDEHIVALLLSLPRSYNTLITALTTNGDELSLAQALVSEEEKRGLYKGKDGGGRVVKDETALQHEKTSREPIRCFGCGEESHVIRNCSKRRKGQHENQNKPGSSSKHKAALADADGKKNEDSGGNVFVVGMIAAEGNSCWIIDSGASQHMTANRDLLVNYFQFPEPEPVALGDGRFVNAYGYRQADITMILGNKEKDQRKSILTKVIYVPKLATNPFSVRGATSRWYNLDTPCVGLRTRRDKLSHVVDLLGTCLALTAKSTILEIKHQLLMKLLLNWICGTKEWRP